MFNQIKISFHFVKSCCRLVCTVKLRSKHQHAECEESVFYLFIYLFFATFFFLFKVIYNREGYFINYNLQTNEKQNLPPTLPVPQATENQPLLPTPPSPTERLNQTKCQKVLVFKTFQLVAVFSWI